MTTTTQRPAAPAVHDWQLWTVDARLAVSDPAALDEAVAITRGLTEEVDQLASRFRPDSLVRELEQTGATALPVPATFAAMVREALAAARLTDGDLDPTLGHAMQRVGYDQYVARIRVEDNRSTIIRSRRPGWRDIRLDGDLLTMPAGLLLDLGATAKSLAADWSARAIALQLGCAAMVGLGGDIATAGSSPDGGWQVEVRDLPEDPGQVITLHDGWSVATSSTQKRRWTTSGQAAHHILDPRTLTPAPLVWRSVTVVAPSCTLANTLSTASVVRGRGAVRWLEQQEVAARLVDREGRVHRVGSWPA